MTVLKLINQVWILTAKQHFQKAFSQFWESNGHDTMNLFPKFILNWILFLNFGKVFDEVILSQKFWNLYKKNILLICTGLLTKWLI
jgi:hypothetical protein